MADKLNIAGTTSGDNVKLDNVILDVYSKTILFKAQPLLRFESVAQKQSDLTVLPGNTLKFLKFNALSGSSALVETTPIETDVLSTSTVSITVSEHGKAVKFSESLLRYATTNVLENAATALGQHYAKNRDALLRDALYTNTNIKYSQAGGAATSRAGLNANSVLDVEALRDAAELLAVNKAPKFGDAYVCFVHPHQVRHIKNDPTWVNSANYAQPDMLLSGEIGRIDDIRFVATTQVAYIKVGTQDIWADNEDTTANTGVAANSNTDVYRALLVGDWALGLAEALPVEMRDNGTIDFGRQHALAYYGIWGAGLIESGHVATIETA